MASKPELKVVSTRKWLTDERQFKTCDRCEYHKKTQYSWLCERDRGQFGILDSPYHTTCRKFKAKDIDNDR